VCCRLDSWCLCVCVFVCVCVCVCDMSASPCGGYEKNVSAPLTKSAMRGAGVCMRLPTFAASSTSSIMPLPSPFRKHALLRAHAQTHTHTHMYTRIHTQMYIHTRVHTRTHTRIHTRTHVYAPTHTCVHTQAASLDPNSPCPSLAPWTTC